MVKLSRVKASGGGWKETSTAINNLVDAVEFLLTKLNIEQNILEIDENGLYVKEIDDKPKSTKRKGKQE